MRSRATARRVPTWRRSSEPPDSGAAGMSIISRRWEAIVRHRRWYFPVLCALSPVVAAIAVLSRSGDRGAQPTTAPGRAAEQGIPPIPEPTFRADVPEPKSRHNAVTLATHLIGTVGTDIERVDVRRMTRAEAVAFLRIEPRNYPGGAGDPPSDRPVFVVRFRGRFTRDAGRFPPRPGTGWVLIDAVTGGGRRLWLRAKTDAVRGQPRGDRGGGDPGDPYDADIVDSTPSPERAASVIVASSRRTGARRGPIALARKRLI